MLESLAELVEAGWLKVREKGSTEWLSPAELRAGRLEGSSRQPWEEDSDEKGFAIFIMPSDRRFDLVWKGGVVKFPSDARAEYDRELEERIDRALRDRGWISGRDFMRWDLRVYLDLDSRIRVA
jgi:hypothetical protein